MNIDKIVDIINKGGLILGPTDTVYGLLGDATNEDTVKKTYEAKQRSTSKSLIVLVGNKELLRKCVSSLSPLEEKLIDYYLPGKLTIIFNKSDYISDTVTGGLKTVGIRIPNHVDLLSILNKVNRPLLSTSANISNQKTITNINEIDDVLKPYLDYIWDGGEINVSSSTIIRVENERIKLLREGKLASSIRHDFSSYIDE